MTDPTLLCGLGGSHVGACDSFDCQVHCDVVQPLMRLQQAAAKAGFGLQLASGYRSFERQLKIWNDKVSGLRPVLDADGSPLLLASLSDLDKVYAILRWSALPGASRHHWGTDIDVYDCAAMAPGYQLQLTPAETCGEGPFAPFHAWLDQCITAGRSEGFIRPYHCDRGGVAPEPWHLSYAPLAQGFQQQLSIELLRRVIEGAELALKAVVLEHLDDIYSRFVEVPEDVYGVSRNQDIYKKQ